MGAKQHTSQDSDCEKAPVSVEIRTPSLPSDSGDLYKVDIAVHTNPEPVFTLGRGAASTLRPQESLEGGRKPSEAAEHKPKKPCFLLAVKRRKGGLLSLWSVSSQSEEYIKINSRMHRCTQWMWMETTLFF